MSDGSPAPIAPASIFAAYRSKPGSYDEAVDASGALRPHWAALFQQLEAIGVSELQRRWEQAEHDTAVDGVTFNPHDSEGDTSRPWVLDAIPLPLPEKEWMALSAGLAQRVTLLDLVLRDLLGPQVLLRERVLPPHALFASPAYHPAYHGLRPAGRRQLDLYAADLSRASDGSWCVTGDRTRTVSGLGYALENRIVASRMLAQPFRQSRVRRLAGFFVALKEMVQAQAPRSRENPRVVLWTEGPNGRRYFEDAYLARYLGYTLAEGGDLAVRSNRLMLKTLGGLLPVEVVLRRLDDALCDPVELRGDSRVGVSGLLEVMRARNVSLVNPPGSALIEAPILMAFLPGICRRLLGEDLKLPSADTWWCGQKRERDYVLEHLDELLIRSAHPPATAPVLRPSRLSGEERRALVAAIRANPDLFVGQQPPVRATTPVWGARGLEPWHVALRAFLVAREDGYVRLPGGLARVAPDAATLDHTMSSGERSQDVWIPSEAPVQPVTLLAAPHETVPLRRGGAELPSRAADNLFWLGRSVEGAEGCARLVRTLFLSSMGEVSDGGELALLLAAVAESGQIDKADFGGMEAPTRARVIVAAAQSLFDEERPLGLRSRILEAQRIVSLVRDRVSVDAWRIVQRLEEGSRRPRWRREIGVDEGLRAIERLINELAAFAGMVGESMTRAPAWRFLDLGRRIERALHTASLLRATLVPVPEEDRAILEAVLRTADSSMTYRSRYLATVQAAPVLDLLLTDDTNPRSIGFQLAAVAEHVAELPRGEAQAALGPDQRLALSLHNAVRLADVAELARTGNEKRREALERLLQRLVDQLPRLSDALSSRFLTHAGLPRHLASSAEGRVAT